MFQKLITSLNLYKVLNACVRPLCISLSILWRTSLANFLLSMLLFGQQPGVLPSQSSQAAQLPASGRQSQSAGMVNSQLSTQYGQGSSVIQPSVQVDGAYAGSVVGRDLPAGELKLSLSEAVRRGLEVNLGSITAATSSMTARAQRAQALSQLLPQISASLGATETQVNLAAFGLNAIAGQFPEFQQWLGLTTMYRGREMSIGTL